MNGYSETINTLASTFTSSVVGSSGAGNYTLTVGSSTSGPATNSTVFNGILQDNIGSGSGVMNVAYNLYNTNYNATLGGVNTYSGLTTLTRGIVYISNSSSLGKHEGSGGLGTVVTSSGSLYMQGGISVGDESLVLNGNMNNGSLYNFSGNNVWGGSITLGSASTIWNQSGSLTVNPASGSAVSGTNLPLTISGNGSSTISGTVSLGTGALTTNNGIVTLMVGNVYSGLTSVANSSVLNIRNSTSLGTSAVTVENGATLQLQGGISVGNALTLKGVGVSSAGSLRSISGDNIYNGAITLSTNTVRINADLNSLTLNGNIAGGSIALYVGGSGNTIMNGVLSGSGGSVTWGATPSQLTVNTSFVKDGAGTVTFVGVNTYTGETVLDGGLLQLGANNVISNSSNVIFDGGRLHTGGYGESVGTLSVLAESSSVTLGSGSHTLSFSGLGTLDYKTLTINGWSGTAGSAGSDGVLRVGNSLSFTRAQLDQFKFSYSSATYSSVQLSDGELVPGITGATGFVNVRITNSGTTNGSWSGSTGGTYTFTPSGNNATINAAEIYTYIYNNYGNVTINTALAAGTQVGQVDINNAVTGDLNSNRNRTLTMNANGDINVNQSITLASSASSDINYTTHSLVLNSTTGSINILAPISTQRVTGNGSQIWYSYSGTSGSITMSAPMGTIYASVAGTLNTSGTVNTNGTAYDGAAGAISLSSMGFRILSTITATSRYNAAQYGNISITNTGTSVTSGGGENDGISGVITGKNFTKAGVGSLKLSANNGWNGTTTISGGTIQLGTGTTVTNATGNIPNTSAVYLAGGDLNDGGFNETMGALWLTNNSTITTGSTSHSLIFSSPGTFTAGKVLTIIGWTGASESIALNKFGGVVATSTEFITTNGARQNVVLGGLNQYGKILYGLAGNVATTSSQIFINTTRLNTTQLGQIQFLNSATNGYYTTVQKASPSFEIVPGVSK
jgi:autotransporter-associated beta strand protein